MTDKKWFDLHIEVGQVTLQNSGNKYPYARTVVGSAGIEFSQSAQYINQAIYLLLTEMDAYAAFTTLKKHPHYSQFPYSSHGNPNYYAEYFLHIEVGESDKLDTYVRTEFHNFEEYEKRCPTSNMPSIMDMISDIIADMAADGTLEHLRFHPFLSIFPLPNSSTPKVAKTLSSPQKKSDIVRQLPSHIIDIPHPQCQDHCTSWDIFGKIKCSNMCEWRSGV